MMASNIPSDVEESVNDALGTRKQVAIKKFMKLETKQDRFDNKIVAFTEFRVLILSAKVPSKIETNIPVLDLQAIESKRPNQLCLMTENKRLSLSALEADSDEVDQMIVFIGTLVSSSFYGVSLEKLIPRVDIQPSDRRTQIQESIMMRSPKEPGPCGGFTPAYACMCDYHGVPFMDDVAWDVDTIYLSHDSRELNLADFDHLDSKHLVPIVAALEFNSWFTKLNCSNVRINSEAANEILRVMKRNTTIQELWLSSVGIRWDFVQKLSMSLLANIGSPLSHIDMSNNNIEDRGLGHFCQPISKLSSGLVHLNLSKTGITGKGVNRLAEALSANRSIPKTLQVLNLSNNSLKGDDLMNLSMFLSQPNALTTLNLSSCDCALDNMFGHLLKGCCGKLEHVDLSNNVFTHKRTKEGLVPLSWKHYFASTTCLKRINLSGCRLPADAVKSLLLGLGSNTVVKNVDVDVSGNDLRSSGSQIIENCIPNVTNISALNIADNNFDLDIPTLCQALSRNKSLKKLSIGRNFNNVKPKYLQSVLGAVVQLIQEEDSGLESLSVADSKLRTETTVIINALGSNSTLTEVDISGNQMGDIGARMLAKALMINTKLRTIYWDRNNTSAQGFQDLASALQKNFVVQTMPTPLYDAMSASKLNPEKTEAALQTIENVLQRNHTPRKLATDQAYRLHQGFLISSSSQMLSRLIEQVEDQLHRLEKGAPTAAKSDITKATNLVKDANKSKLVLGKLQEVVVRSEEESSAVNGKLKDITTDLHTLINNTIQKNTSDMLKCAEDQCPSVLEDKTIQNEIRVSCNEKATLDQDFTHSLIMQSVRTDVINKISELNLAVATCMSDRLIDNVLDSLDECHKKLINHVNTKLSSPTEEPLTVVSPQIPRQISHENGSVITGDDPQSTLKRKSLYSRRLRPQSVIAGKGAEEEETDGIKVDTVSKGGLDLPALSPIPQSPASPASASTTPSSIEATSPITSKTKPVAQQRVQIADLPKLETEPKLEHLCRDRPKRPKTRAVSRAVVKSSTSGGSVKSIQDEETMGTVDEGLGDFFKQRKISKEHVVPDKTTQRENEINKEKSEDSGKSDKKKGWSPFGRKADTKGIAAGISNFFKKDKASPTSAKSPPEMGRTKSPEIRRRETGTRSPEVRRRDTGEKESKTPELDRRPSPAARKSPARELEESKSEDEEKKDKSEDELEDESPSRKPPGIPKYGMPGMGSGTSALLAEMKAKRATTVKPTVDQKKDENKENQGVPAPRPVSSILRPKPAPRSASPNTQKEIKEEKNEKTTAASKIEDVGSGSGGRVKPPPPTRPKPPPVAPKPRGSVGSKPTPPATRNSNVPSTATSPSTRIQSESIDKDQLPPDPPAPDSPPPERPHGKMRRLSIKDRIAALPLEANNNTTTGTSNEPADPPKKSSTLPPMSSAKFTDLPHRAQSVSDANSKSNNNNTTNIDDNIAKQLDGLTAAGTSPTNQKPRLGGAGAAGKDGGGLPPSPANGSGSSPGLKTDKTEKEFVVFI